MKNHKTPKPGSSEYNVEKTEDLNTPKFHSSTDRRNSKELPAIENLNDQPESTLDTENQDLPKTNLGNKRKADEHKRERIINP